jgi:hypothetical protein
MLDGLAVERWVLVLVAHVEDGNFSKIDTSVLLQGLHVVVLSASDEVVFLFHELVVVLAWCFYVGFDFLLLLSQSSCIGIWHWIMFFFFTLYISHKLYMWALT